MLNLSIELPETVAATLGKTPQEFISNSKFAAIVDDRAAKKLSLESYRRVFCIGCY
jgi:hypothetical protein